MSVFAEARKKRDEIKKATDQSQGAAHASNVEQAIIFGAELAQDLTESGEHLVTRVVGDTVHLGVIDGDWLMMRSSGTDEFTVDEHRTKAGNALQAPKQIRVNKSELVDMVIDWVDRHQK